MAITNSVVGGENVGVVELRAQLDSLLEQYLYLLDEYQRARDQLHKDLSSGFFSLAQANYSSPGRRYGQDYYDERMQASRRVAPKVPATIVEQGTRTETSFDVFYYMSEPRETKADQDVADDEKKTDGNREVKEEQIKTTVNKDPLRWFGILIPQPLRSTQQSFIKAVEGPIPQLVALQVRIKDTEIAIGRLRKNIKKAERRNEG